MATLLMPCISRFLASPHLRPALNGHGTTSDFIRVSKSINHVVPRLWARITSAQAASRAVENDLQGYWKHVYICNSGRERQVEFLPFIVEDSKIGYIHPKFLKHLRRFPEVFIVRDDVVNGMSKGWVTLHELLQTPQLRTDAIGVVLLSLEMEGLIPGWRNEHYPVVISFGGRSLFSLERAAVPFFGIKAYGVHMNGYVQVDGEKHLWVAKRSATKQTFPGMLDHLVAGGQSEGIGCKENLLKECDEEAAIPAFLAEKATAVGAVSYEQIKGEAFKRDVLFCYDLELPADFQPSNKDGEVESFELVPVAEVAEIIRTSQRYKPNCALVVIDFLFRNGYIHPDQPGYLQLLQSLRSGECQ
ncbi:nudix hydrolase 20, chloroplastic-like isoform X1 [Physcomitrium patens]|uniref:Nudix hydrolase domain-containing protein n=1 Tax=Physcomitrium patens TaxID=3218 RepID=A0A7I4F2D8_PHYPA|nr:nudix hydrolase 20, chloroplastic-like [Physcomitrium patens]|eukprot:XP_024390700.1 nudix hydrolase 20, chloroplastic-like [Physcomitrella patens]